MPVVFQRKHSNYHLAIWHTTEETPELLHSADLNDKEFLVWNGFKSLSRQREWLTVRILLRFLTGKKSSVGIFYDIYGKPNIQDGRSVSVSHTRDYVAVIVTEAQNAGIDLETIRENISLIAHKFTGTEESRFLEKINSPDALHVLWGIKEVMYKIYGKKELDFRKHIFSGPFKNYAIGEAEGRIRKENTDIRATVQYLKWNGMMLAWAVC